VSEYIKKFDQFMMRCSEKKPDAIILSYFRSGLENDLRHELIIRDVSTLKHAIQIVQDLDQSQVSSFPKRTTIGIMPTKLPLLNLNPIHTNLNLVLGRVAPLQGMKIKARESQVSHLNPFSRLDISSAKGLITFQHSVRVRQGC